MQNISEIEDLVKLISKLPGLGPKSAKRIVLKLINNRDELIKPMAKALVEVYKNISRCKICGSLKPTSIECNYYDCKIVEKKYDKICVVEDIADQWSIENSNIYKGYFHILGGTIASAGHRKQDLLIDSLVERVTKDKIEEGYWNERNIPALALSKTSISSRGVPLNLISPDVISYAGWPIMAFARVDLPEPFKPKMPILAP